MREIASSFPIPFFLRRALSEGQRKKKKRKEEKWTRPLYYLTLLGKRVSLARIGGRERKKEKKEREKEPGRRQRFSFSGETALSSK